MDEKGHKNLKESIRNIIEAPTFGFKGRNVGKAKSQTGLNYALIKVSLSFADSKLGKSTGVIAVIDDKSNDAHGKPARHGSGVWVWGNEISAQAYVKKFR